MPRAAYHRQHMDEMFDDADLPDPIEYSVDDELLEFLSSDEPGVKEIREKFIERSKGTSNG